MNKSILAISTLTGTIIGAGIYGIPYAISKSGVFIGITHIIIIALITLLTLLYLGEISLRTKQTHHLTGYAEKYLGTNGKYLMLFSLIFGICAAILAYLIGVGESLSFIFYNTNSYALQLGILFWILMSITSYFGIKALEEGEFIGVSIALTLIISISVFLSNKININNILQISPSGFLSYFAPFGVIFFAFLGYTSIPEIKKILYKKENKMKSSIIATVFICTLIYTLFALLVIGFKGANTPQIATIALGKPFILLGILTMSTSYLALSISMIDTLQFDLNFSRLKAWLSTISVPIILFAILQLAKKASFTKVLSIGGVISGGLTAILILFMTHNAKFLGDRKPEYSMPLSKILNFILILIFVIAIIIEIIAAI